VLAQDVELDVFGGGAQELRIIAEQPETLVASLAEQHPDLAAGMIVIKMLGS
jgi:hypothetical protein